MSLTKGRTYSISLGSGEQLPRPPPLLHIHCLITHVITASDFRPAGEELLLFLTRSPVLQKGTWGT